MLTELLDATLGIDVAPPFDGVDGAFSLELVISDVRGRFTAIESPTFSVLVIGRFRACGGGGSMLADRSFLMSFLGGPRASSLCTDLVYFLLYFSVTINLRGFSFGLSFPLISFRSSSSSFTTTCGLLPFVGESGGCVLWLASEPFVGVFFMRANSSSSNGGSVGESSSGSFKGDFGLLIGGGGSAREDFCDLLCSGGSSRLFSFDRESDSFGRCSGDSNGGTADLEDAVSALARPLEEGLGLLPLIESPRARDMGDLFAPEPKAVFKADRPFGNEDEFVPSFPSFCGVLSCDGCISFLLGVSSRGVRDRSSSGVLASGLARF